MKEKLRLQFLGASGTVTGSRTLLEHSGKKILIDAGLYQGSSALIERNYAELSPGPASLDFIILTHCHIDHSGLLPRYVKEGFTGKIYCTPATADLLQIQLPDAAQIQEEEFAQSKKNRKSDGPLYKKEHALQTLNQLQVIQFESWVSIGGLSFLFQWAGHILGAASVRLHYGKYKFLFSGDIGQPDTILHKGRKPLATEDYIICESTYGAKNRPMQNYQEIISKHIKHIIDWNSILLIPAFAIGRTQLIIYVLYEMMKAGKIPEIPIILDSPMAVKATQVYSRYPEELTKAVQSSGYIDFLQSKNIELIQDVESSRQLQERRGPFILVSASGMCQGGRILHHLRSRLGDSRNVLLFVGYQAESSLGFQILNGNRRIKLLGENIFVQCQLDYIGSFSSHADQAGLVDFFVKAPGEMPKRVFLNHGTEESRTALAGLLEPEGYQVFLPRNEAVYYL